LILIPHVGDNENETVNAGLAPANIATVVMSSAELQVLFALDFASRAVGSISDFPEILSGSQGSSAFADGQLKHQVTPAEA
jgi:hypothetical protein